MKDSDPASPAHDNSIRGYWQLVRIVCFSIITPFAIAVAFAVVPQGIEMLHTLVESPYYNEETRTVPLILFVIASILFAHLARFWASALLDYRYPAFQLSLLPGPNGIARARVWIPKSCAALVHIGIAVGFLRSGMTSPGNGRALLYSASSVYAVLACIQILSACFRTRLPTERTSEAAFQTFKLRMQPGESRQHKLTRIYAIITLIVALGLIILFAYGADGIGREFGAATLFCLAGCCWVTFGNFLRLLALHYRLPLISGAFVAALVFSLWVDNHKVHTIPATTKTAPSERESLRELYRDWHTKVQTTQPLPTGMPRPLFVVAAEGGGIRAAFWTSKVLCTLQQLSLTPRADGTKPVEFAPHAFALSGVSGGSLGSAVFAAMCADGMSDQVSLADNMLSRDHLAPIMAKMFFPDMLQRFLPFSWNAADRARGLERSWEIAWREQINPRSDRFAKPFHSLWANTAPDAPHVPNLFLNATVVETGQRIIASNVPIRNNGGSQFLDSRDASDSLTKGEDFSLSSAAHLSARFTYFSPAGRIDKDNRVVDGGYFENSGSVTAMEILRTIKEEIAHEKKRNPSAEDVIPVLILISNEPTTPSVAHQAEAAAIAMIQAAAGLPIVSVMTSKDPRLMTTAERFEAMPDSFASESLAPIRALVNTRESRGSLAKIAAYYEFNPIGLGNMAGPGLQYPLFQDASDRRGRFLHFRLTPGSVLLPLGWSLSGPTCEEMNRQLWQWSTAEGEDWKTNGKRPATLNPALLSGVMQMLGNSTAAESPFSTENRYLIP